MKYLNIYGQPHDFNLTEINTSTLQGAKYFLLKAKLNKAITAEFRKKIKEIGITNIRISSVHELKYDFYIPYKDGNEVQNYLEFLNEMDFVEYVVPNIKIDPSPISEVSQIISFEQISSSDQRLYNDTLYPQQWHFKNSGIYKGTKNEDCKIEKALAFIARTKLKRYSIKIAIIDDGIDPKHPDINPLSIILKDDLVSRRNKPFANPNDSHGTYMAGIISAISDNKIGVAGINNYAKLIIIRAFTSYKSRKTATRIAKAIDLAVKYGARIINISWGIRRWSDEIEESIRNAVQHNVLLVISSGNYKSKRKHQVFYPGSTKQNVITVGAVENNGRWMKYQTWVKGNNRIKFGSAYGAALDLVAPGFKIPTTRHDMPNSDIDSSFGSIYGTSPATAIVSGIASILLSICPDITVDELKKIILETADNIVGKQEKTMLNISEHIGHGRVNALRAVRKLVQSHMPSAIL